MNTKTKIVILQIKILYTYFRKIIHYTHLKIDKYLSIWLYYVFHWILISSNIIKKQLERYIRKSRYNDMNQFKINLTWVDIAYISLSVWDHIDLTREEIQTKYRVSEWDSIRIKKLTKDPFKAIRIIKDSLQK